MLGLLAQSVETARNDSYFYSLMFMLLGVSVAIGFFFQVSLKFNCILMRRNESRLLLQFKIYANTNLLHLSRSPCMLQRENISHSE